MPYHVKSTGAMGTGTVYYEGGDTWTQTYADRKQFSAQADANAVKNTQVTRTMGPKSYTYTPDFYANSTVVSE